MKNAVAMPISAINASRSIDCDITAAKGSRKDSTSCTTVFSASRSADSCALSEGVGISAAVRDAMNAAIEALPSSWPRLPAVLYTPEPAPASWGASLRVAVAVGAGLMNASPRPSTIVGIIKCDIEVSGTISNDSHANATATVAKAHPSTGR
ncbi:hypothetical protein OSH39_15470 [Mycobacterium ulcerans]|uniref:Lipoprotein n=1 Tax=Mycobacterium ulcerans TaxID=1809 RepID=A0ABY3V996_MYCUL|nr:hypothetical protein [Mycobacterium ulcerans]MEB3910346.1 hypothetical protein [Mycobacterium ulcerans]MEB3970341.1 hypothetical protein [Mycobacterium ulcerans]MEB3978605.1 hypothetical protein [Mycobacterium ulcerans]MEB3995435.1 hypothetical protein [Mycobacterium ulcerans]